MSDAANAKAISAILRAIGNADEAKERKTDVVFLEAAKLIDAAYGTSPTPPHPAQSSGGAKDAPVAWRLKYNGCDLIEVYISEEEAKRHARNYNAELQPLYLHPSPPEPSDAAVEALRQIASVCEDNRNTPYPEATLRFVHAVASTALTRAAISSAKRGE